MLFLFFFFFLFFASLGAIRAEYEKNNFSKRESEFLSEAPVEMGASFVQELGGSKSGKSVILKVVKEKKDGVFVVRAPFLVRATVQGTDEFKYGYLYALSGNIQNIENFNSKETGNIVFFDNISKSEDILFSFYFPQIEETDIFVGNPVLAFLFKAKDSFVSHIENLLAEPYASLVSGMTIAGKGGISENVKNDFVRSGLVHIVVLSGYNIALVVSFLAVAFSRFGRGKRIFFSLLGILLFTLITGGGAPIVRSALMAGVIILSKMYIRKVSTVKVLLFVCALMVFWSPFILLWNTSFILSFLATFAVISLSPVLKTTLFFFPEKFSFRQIVADTLSVSLLVYPYLLLVFGTVSTLALFSNLLVLPIIPFVMISGIFLGVCGGIPGLGKVFAFVSLIIAKYIVFVAEFFSSFSFAQIQLKITLPVMVFLYIIIILFFLFLRKRAENLSS